MPTSSLLVAVVATISISRFMMMRLSIIWAFFPLLTCVLAAPEYHSYAGITNGKHIVKFKDDVSPETWVKKMDLIDDVKWAPIINGLSGALSEEHLDSLRSSPEVEYIAEDGLMHINSWVTQTNAPWGVGRLSSPSKLGLNDISNLGFNYTFDETAGNGVDIYVVDTGVYLNHTQFGGRARWGISVDGYPEVDGHGHGTHIAGTAAGSQFGVAKKASIIAIKAIGDDGSGSISGIITGLNWAKSQAQSSGRASVLTMSFGGYVNQPIDDAVKALTAAGIHVTVSAGNNNDDADWYSPGRVPSAITVGASDINDARAYFSNFGPDIDVFAPGVGITSATIGSPTATTSMTGTSMAAPHVAGLVAYLISAGGNLSPDDMSTLVKNLAAKGVLSDIPFDTSNYLAHLPA
ncbi:serine protease [Crepidotus variabilis]|uniref:Serine protease n=1 Tax=Crepidotus variabilis TaxID=179855 RepID=A0A9P6EKM5_9AGAR|nr:serine protease [Crepidotus variabilis]